jgi:hypothetical protein
MFFAALCLLIAALCLTEIANGSQVVWTNGHTYEAVFVDDNLTWEQARDQAAAMTLGGQPGYLATFTTRAEQEFVIASLGGGEVLNALWLGGYQDQSAPDYSEPYGGWRWITGETWLGVATDDPTIPRSFAGFNNTYFDFRTEEHTITWWRNGGINDYNHEPLSQDRALGYIVEFNAPVISVAWHFEFADGVPVKFAWQAEAGKNYDLWRSGDLAQWTHVDGFPKQGAGTTMEYPFTAGVQGFFRIAVTEVAPTQDSSDPTSASTPLKSSRSSSQLRLDETKP